MKLPLSGAIGKPGVKLPGIAKSIVVISLLVLILTACNDDENVHADVAITSEMSAYLFDINSEWVYEYPATHAKETAWVVSTKKIARPYRAGNTRGFIFNWQMDIRNTGNGETNTTEVSAYGWWRTFQEKAFLRIGGDKIVDSNRIYYFYRNMENHDTFTVAGNQYKNVHRIQLMNAEDSITPDYEQYWIADSIGVIKWELYQNKKRVNTKNLISHKIKLAPVWYK